MVGLTVRGRLGITVQGYLVSGGGGHLQEAWLVGCSS